MYAYLYSFEFKNVYVYFIRISRNKILNELCESSFRQSPLMDFVSYSCPQNPWGEAFLSLDSRHFHCRSNSLEHQIHFRRDEYRHCQGLHAQTSHSFAGCNESFDCREECRRKGRHPRLRRDFRFLCNP